MDKQPNFLFIFPDQWRHECLSAFGHEIARTPFIDDIVSRGISFTSAYSACPSCIATRASLMSGLTPYSAGRVGYKDCVPWEYDSLVGRMREGGYQTMCVGKTHFYPERAHLGFEQLELYSEQNHDRDEPSDYHKWLKQKSGDAVQDTAEQISGTSWVATPWMAEEKLHPSSWNASRSIELLQHRDPQRPFFMQVSFHRPHQPYDPPFEYYQMYKNCKIQPKVGAEWSGKYACPARQSTVHYGEVPQKQWEEMWRCYYAQIEHIDYQVGRILYYLHTEGLMENTYIIFTSDHGDMMGEHHLYNKCRPFEAASKVPFVIAPPRGTQGVKPGTDATPVAHMDMLPTFMELAGMAVPEHVQGKSLTPIIFGGTLKNRHYIHGEHTLPQQNEGWQYLTDGKEKYVWESMSGEELFFDLQDDPKECQNLIDAPERQGSVEQWRKRLVDILAQRSDYGLSDGKKLIAGKVVPPITAELAARVQQFESV